MASSRKPRTGKRIAVAVSGGVDSVVLLHRLKDRPGIRALHVHHGLSPNADAWAAFCRKLCRRWRIPLSVHKVKVQKAGEGLEAAARAARYAVFKREKAEVIALAHNLDDQAETVLMNLLRGAGPRGASGMQPLARHGDKQLARPLLGVSRREILEYARRHGLEWIEDESNADESLTRNFVRLRLGPVIETRFPQWQRSLARAARLFARKESHAETLLRNYLKSRGLRAPSEAKLVEMLKQLTAGGARTRIEHDGLTLRVYRGKVLEERATRPFAPRAWRGERRLSIPELGGELRFTPGEGIDSSWVKKTRFEVRLRSGGERLQLHPRRPRRTLKNLFQEAGVPSWARERLPLLYCGEELVWAPGVGVDVRYRGRGLVPEWRT
ncbi:MAG TPA: tRNA lysidine(34) synthetase TilS [Burkholderiales bacterium]|nr:tRNA lysidine(34) synthetase TilS [Burkholderiales bacterium]